MHRTDLLRLLDDFAGQAESCVRRAAHMSEIRPTDEVKPSVVNAVLKRIESRLPNLGHWPNKYVVLQALDDIVSDLFLDSDRIEQAIAVAFVNFVGRSRGVEYALYTSDLRKAR